MYLYTFFCFGTILKGNYLWILTVRGSLKIPWKLFYPITEFITCTSWNGNMLSTRLVLHRYNKTVQYYTELVFFIVQTTMAAIQKKIKKNWKTLFCHFIAGISRSRQIWDGSIRTRRRGRDDADGRMSDRELAVLDFKKVADIAGYKTRAFDVMEWLRVKIKILIWCNELEN